MIRLLWLLPSQRDAVSGPTSFLRLFDHLPQGWQAFPVWFGYDHGNSFQGPDASGFKPSDDKNHSRRGKETALQLLVVRRELDLDSRPGHVFIGAAYRANLVHEFAS